MSRILWSDAAQAELRAIAKYYDLRDRNLTDRLLARIDRAPLILLDQPRLGARTRARGVRKWLVRSTPFLLLYKVSGSDIEIVFVRHERTDWR